MTTVTEVTIYGFYPRKYRIYALYFEVLVIRKPIKLKGVKHCST